MQRGGGRRPFELVPEGRWASKSAAERCTRCGKAFGIFRSPDNCHACGRVFCSSACLDNAMVLPGHPGTAPVPVCDECANAIRRIQQDSEMAVHRCQILEELLNEQTSQSEVLIKQSKELRSENGSLMKEREALQGEVKKLELQLEVAVARNNLHSSGLSEAGSSAASSPVVAARGGVEVGASLPSGDDAVELEKKLEKKKKLLDMREATLQEALKKVSNDAAKVVSQRNALQEQERSLRASVTAELTSAFAAMRAGLEGGVLADRSQMLEEFRSWMRDAAQREEEARRAADEKADAETPSAAAADAVVASGVPQGEVDALHARHEVELEQLKQAQREEVAAMQGRLEETQRALKTAEATCQEQAQQLTALQETQRRGQTWEEDKLILQGSVSALKRALEEAQGKATAAQAELDGLRAEREKCQAASAAAQELREQLDAAQAERERAEATHKALCAQQEELIHSLRQSIEKAHEATEQAVAEECERCASQHARAMREIQERHHAAMEELEQKHATQLRQEREQRERAASQQTAAARTQRDAAEAEEMAALTAALAEARQERIAAEAQWQAVAKKALDEQSAALQKQHAAERERLEASRASAVSQLQTSHAEEVAALTADRDELKGQCETLRAEVQSLAEQMQRWKQRVEEPEGERTRTASGVEVSLTSNDDNEATLKEASGAQPAELVELSQQVDLSSLAAGILDGARVTYLEALEEQAAGLGAALSFAHAIASAAEADATRRKTAERQWVEERDAQESTHGEVVAKLQRQLKAAKRESQGHEQHSKELAQEALQQKRAAAEQTQELAQLREKLKQAQRTASRAERNLAAAATAATPPEKVPSAADSAAVAAFAAGSMRWERAAVALWAEYADRVSAAVADDLFAVYRETLSTLSTLLEKYRAVGRRNAAALEQTTNTIRTVQADLRTRAEELTAREEALGKREARLTAAATALKKKRQTVTRVCEGLHVVVGRLRERGEETGAHDDAVAAVAEESAALIADDTGNGADLSDLKGVSP